MKPFFPYSITSILNKVRHSNPRGGGGVLLIFSYIGRGSGYLFVWFKILNFEFFFLGGGGGGVQKNEYGFGYDTSGSSKNWTIFRGHFYAF